MENSFNFNFWVIFLELAPVIIALIKITEANWFIFRKIHVDQAINTLFSLIKGSIMFLKLLQILLKQFLWARGRAIFEARALFGAHVGVKHVIRHHVEAVSKVEEGEHHAIRLRANLQ